MLRGMTALVLVGPVIAGLAGVVLPAFGHFPPAGATGPSLSIFRMLIDEPGVWTSVWLTVRVGLLSAFLALLIALLIVGAGFRNSVYLGPILAMPHAAVAFGIAFLLAPSGLLVRWIAPFMGIERPPQFLFPGDPEGWGMVAGLVLKEVPFLVFMALSALPRISQAGRSRMANSLGYGPFAAFWLVTVAELYPLIRLPVLLVLTYSLSVVDVAMILGPTTPPTLPVLITRWMNAPDVEMRMIAAAATILQVGVIVLSILVWKLLEQGVAAAWKAIVTGGHRAPVAEGLRRPVLGLPLVGAFAVFGGGVVLLLWSFAGYWGFPDGLPVSFTLQNWSRHGALAIDSVRATILMSGIAGGVAVLVALALLETGHDLPDPILFLPLIVPQVAFLPGLQILALHIGLTGGVMAVVLSHLVFALPYAVLVLRGTYERRNIAYEKMAGSLGASPLQVFYKVRLPMLLGPLLTAFAVSFGVSVAQYLPTLLLGAGRVSTLTTEAVALASGGDRRAIAVFAVLQAAVALGPFVIASGVPAYLWRQRKGMRHA